MSTERRNQLVGDRKILFAYKLIWALATLNLALFGAFAWTQFQFVEAGGPGSLGMVYLLGIVTTLLTFSALGLALYSVVHSHRLLGAAHRIQVALREAKQGPADEPKVVRVQLREGDHLEPLARDLNELVGTSATDGRWEVRG